MAVSNQMLFLYNNGKKVKNSKDLEVLWKAVAVSSDGNNNGFTITQGVGGFDFGSKKLTNVASGTASGQALVYDQIGAANGVCGLDAGQKIPVQNLPNSIMEYKGTFNPSTHVPNLQNTGAAIASTVTINGLLYTADTAGAAGDLINIAYTTGGTAGSEVVSVVGNAISVQIESGVSTTLQIQTAVNTDVSASALVTASGGDATTQTAPVSATYLAGGADAANAGDVYKATASGTHNFGAGGIAFVTGDYAIYNGTSWELAHSGADAVISVNGKAGVVVLGTDDVAEGTTNLYFSGKTTDDLSEGSTNLYFASGFAAATTDGLTEGTTNLYFATGFAAATTDGLTEGTTNLYFSGKTTDALPEGTTNLYFASGFAAATTDGLTEGTTNLYFATGFAAATTDGLTEGTTNLYFSGKTSDALPEGTTNLYFTTGFAAATTDGLTEGTTNLYFTTGFAAATTDGLTEGTTNLYFSGKTSDALPEGTTNLYFTTGFAAATTDGLTEGTTNLYFSGKTTDALPEGTTNLYFSGKTSDDLAEGTTNLYFATGFAAATTDGLTEGTTNLYFSGKDSDDLPEGTVNLYFTTGFAAATTDGLTEGTTNLYFASGFAAATTDGLTEGTTNLYFSGKDSDDLAEGTVNLYFTDGRAQTAVVASSIVDGDTTHAPSGEAVYEALAALGSSSSFKSYTNKEVGAITIRQFVYQSAAGEVLLLRADAALANDYVVFGSVKDASIAADTSGSIFLPHMGVRIGGFSGLDVTKPVYASRTTAGGYIQSLAGFVAGEYVILLGQPISATEIIFIGQVEYQIT